MYDIINNMIQHTWTTGSNEQSTLYYICGALILLFSVVLLDMVYRTFRNFWRS